jgi:hypothetical protein
VTYLPIPISLLLEAVAARLFFENQQLTLCSLYLPPDLDNDSLKQSLTSLINILPTPVVFTTDANAHHLTWGSPASDHRGNILADWIEEHDLITLNNGEPTYLSSNGAYTHIDLTICSPDIAPLFQWQPYHDPLNSDHFPLIISTDLSLFTTPAPPRWKLSEANWALFQSSLTLPTSFLSPTQACGAVTTQVLTAAQTAVPLTTAQSQRKYSVWWTPECSKARKEKKQALTRYKNHLGDLDLWIMFKKARARFRMAITTAQRESWTRFLNSFTCRTNIAEVWAHVRMLQHHKRKQYRSPVLNIDGQYITSPPAVSDCLAQYYSRSGTFNQNPAFAQHKRQSEREPIVFSQDNTASYNSPFTLSELLSALSSSHSRSPGPDTIPYTFLHHFTSQQYQQLLSFFNYIYSNGYPHQWREGHIIPILKPHKTATLLSSYRPITLTNCLAKLLGKMVNRRLQHFLESIEYFDSNQSGFRATHSTLDGICRLEHYANTALLSGQYCTA